MGQIGKGVLIKIETDLPIKISHGKIKFVLVLLLSKAHQPPPRQCLETVTLP